MVRLLQENLGNNAVNPFIAEDRKAMLLKLIGYISQVVQSSEHGIILCNWVGKIRQKSNLPYGQRLIRKKRSASDQVGIRVSASLKFRSERTTLRTKFNASMPLLTRGRLGFSCETVNVSGKISSFLPRLHSVSS